MSAIRKFRPDDCRTADPSAPCFASGPQDDSARGLGFVAAWSAIRRFGCLEGGADSNAGESFRQLCRRSLRARNWDDANSLFPCGPSTARREASCTAGSIAAALRSGRYSFRVKGLSAPRTFRAALLWRRATASCGRLCRRCPPNRRTRSATRSRSGSAASQG